MRLSGAFYEAARVHHSALRCNCVAACSTCAATRTRATPWRVDERRRNDPEGRAQLSGFTQALAQLGWTNGRNLQMEIRWGGGGDVNRARNFAKELVGLQPDVILAQGTPVTAALHRETQTIPIVFVVVTDPVGDGFVAGLPHPGGNITGFLTSEAGITAKMLELLREIRPV